MAATYSRHSAQYATPTKALPITMPSKAPAYPYPVSRVAMSPLDYSDNSTVSSGRHSNSAGSYSVRGSDYAPSISSRHYDSSHGDNDVDVSDLLSKRMSDAFDPITMDKSLARQAQDSGRLNAKQRELAELQALAQRRLKTARVNFAQGVEDAKEARRDLEYCRKKTESMKSRAERHHPEEYARASSKAKSRSRHA